jgi:hypothetical protein
MNNLNSTDIFYILLGLLAFYILIDMVWLRPKIVKEESTKIIKSLKCSKELKNIWKNDSIGIVMNIDSDNFHQAVFTVACLKRIGCNLPIWASCESLTDRQKKILKDMKVVVSKELSQADSVISAPFRQILYVSPGVVFFKNPVNLLNNGHYTKTGCLFWKTPNFGISGTSIIRKIIPYNIPDNPILMKQGSKCSDSRVFLIDKAWHLKGLGKLSVLKSFDNISFPELYWISFELAGEDYHFIDDNTNINGMDAFKAENELCWIDVQDVDKLDIDISMESPLNYFKRSFQEGENFNYKPKIELSLEDKEILNEYRKVDHHLKEIL